ncbi:MAG: hypothetical protein J1F63_08385 [Oscillospiraceae bacterium]|nr:hypothetical protein [Oscillospiraceae bacterium]
MYDGLDRIPIKNMSFKQLRERVQVLQDRYDTLIRRYPELNNYGASGEKIDWANIVAPFLRATVNRFIIKAVVDSSSAERIYTRPENGAALNEDGEYFTLSHSLIYKYIDEDTDETELWYWNGNEWKSSPGGFSSLFTQTPAGFQLSGTLELQTDTNGRVTVTDSFIKMYPEVDGAPSYIPKLQIGYDDKSDNRNPVIILGQGSGDEVTESIGYPLRFGQAIVHKTAAGLTLGAVGDTGLCRWIEIKAQATPDDPREPGLYYSYERENEEGEREVITRAIAAEEEQKGE